MRRVRSVRRVVHCLIVVTMPRVDVTKTTEQESSARDTNRGGDPAMSYKLTIAMVVCKGNTT